MDKCREEFEEWFKTTQYFSDYFTDSDLNLNHRNEFENEIINSAWLTFQPQQAKVEGLQKRVDAALQEVFKCRVAGLNRIYALDLIEQALKGEGNESN